MSDHFVLVQARFLATRLPGKVLLPLTASRTLLAQVLQDLNPDSTLVLGVAGRSDDGVAQAAEGLGYAVFRGSERQVLSRFHHAALVTDKPFLVRVTADNPFTQKQLISEAVARLAQTDADYLSVVGVPLGCGFEVIRRYSFLNLCETPLLPSHWLEHVTPGFYEEGSKFRCLTWNPGIESISHLRLTVDCEKDLQVARNLADRLDGDYSLNAIAKAYEQDPEPMLYNQDVIQKSFRQ